MRFLRDFYGKLKYLPVAPLIHPSHPVQCIKVVGHMGPTLRFYLGAVLKGRRGCRLKFLLIPNPYFFIQAVHGVGETSQAVDEADIHGLLAIDHAAGIVGKV